MGGLAPSPRDAASPIASASDFDSQAQAAFDHSNQIDPYQPRMDAIDSADSKNEVDACALCLEELRGDVKRLPCGHQFHSECKAELFTWGHYLCPICRSPWLREVIISHIRTLRQGSHVAWAEAAAALRNLAEIDENYYQDV